MVDVLELVGGGHKSDSDDGNSETRLGIVPCFGPIPCHLIMLVAPWGSKYYIGDIISPRKAAAEPTVNSCMTSDSYRCSKTSLSGHDGLK